MPEDRQVETLLRATGRRPAVPDDVTARVEAAARAHWHAEIRRHARRRRAWASMLAAAAAVAVIVGLSRWPRAGGSPASGHAALIEIVSESAWLQGARNEPPKPLRPGDEVGIGADLATETRGRVALRLRSGPSVRLDAGTRVSVVSDRAIVLTRGAIYVDSRHPPGAAAGSLEIHTPVGTVRNVGTQFEVRRLPASVRIRVREGTVTLGGAAAVLEVQVGHELEVTEDGRMARREWSPSDAGMEWIESVTPMARIEGRPLQEFLEWIARERGLRLQFADSDIARSAPRIILNGSIDGMTLDQALESVLLTCRMSHRMEHDALIIQKSAESSQK